MLGAILLFALGLFLIFWLGGTIGLVLGIIVCVVAIAWLWPAGGYRRRGWY